MMFNRIAEFRLFPEVDLQMTGNEVLACVPGVV